MDKKNRRRTKRLCKGDASEVRLFLDYAFELLEREVADPCHSGSEGFEHVMDLIEAASERLLKDIRQQHLPAPVHTTSMKTEDAELLGRVPRSLRAMNGITQPERSPARERPAALSSDVLADLLLPGGVRTSLLGPGSSRDIDLHLLAWLEPARLEALDPLALGECAVGVATPPGRCRERRLRLRQVHAQPVGGPKLGSGGRPGGPRLDPA